MKHKPQPSMLWLASVLALLGMAQAALAQTSDVASPPPASPTTPSPTRPSTTTPIARERQGPLPTCLTALAPSTGAPPDAGPFGTVTRTARGPSRRNPISDGFETGTDQP